MKIRVSFSNVPIVLAAILMSILFVIVSLAGRHDAMKAQSQIDRKEGIVLCINGHSSPGYLELRGVYSMSSDRSLLLTKRDDGVWCKTIPMASVWTNQIWFVAAPAMDGDAFTVSSLQDPNHPLASLIFKNRMTTEFVFVHNVRPVVINVDNPPEAR